VLRALDLDSAWDEECHETLTLLSWYGLDGTQYEDSWVVAMIENNSASELDSMASLQRLLRFIDTMYTEDRLGPSSQQIEAVAPLVTSWALVHSQSSGQTLHKCCKLSANVFIDIAAVEDEQEDTEKDMEEPDHCPQAVGPSGKLTFQQRIDAIIHRLDRRMPEQTTFGRPEVLQVLEGIVLPYEKLIFIVDFFSGMFYKSIFTVVSFPYIMYSWCQSFFL